MTKIQLFRDGVKIAESTQSPLQYTLGRVSSGTYTFTARAIDNVGFVRVSPPAAFTVVASGPVVSLQGEKPFFTAIQFLSADDVSHAMPFFSNSSASDYQQACLSIESSVLGSIMTQIPQLLPVFISGNQAQYYFQQTIDGQLITFTVDFVKENGTWKIDTF